MKPLPINDCINLILHIMKTLPRIFINSIQPTMPTDIPLDPTKIINLITAIGTLLNAIANLLRALKRPK
jgi:hypothetical protein